VAGRTPEERRRAAEERAARRAARERAEREAPAPARAVDPEPARAVDPEPAPAAEPEPEPVVEEPVADEPPSRMLVASSVTDQGADPGQVGVGGGRSHGAIVDHM